MADVEHAQLPDELLHEPKGASTASDGEVYVANGAGSGSFQKLPTTSIDMTLTAVSALSDDADLPTAVSKINELIAALQDEGLLQ
jgi:hypothetical protein